MSYPSEPPVSHHPEVPEAVPPKPWSWWLALLLVPAMFLVQIIVGVVVAVPLGIAGAVGYGPAQEWLMPLAMIAGSLGFLGMLLLTRLKPGTKPLWDKQDFRDWRNWAWAFGALVLSAGANIARVWVEENPEIPELNQQVMAMLESPAGTPWGPLLMMGITVVILAPLTEEWFFRGLLLPALQRAFGGRMTWLGPWVAVPVSSLVFGLMHWPVWWVPAVYGAVIGLLSVRLRSLALPMLVHFAINLTVFSLLLGTA